MHGIIFKLNESEIKGNLMFKIWSLKDRKKKKNPQKTETVFEQKQEQ